MSCIVSKNCVSPDADFPTNSKKTVLSVWSAVCLTKDTETYGFL